MEYKYVYHKKKLISRYTATKIIEALNTSRGYVKLSFDLGISEEDVKIMNYDSIVVIDGFKIEIDLLKELIDSNDIYCLEDEDIVKVAFYADGKYYKLRYVAEKAAPTLEINGIHMHRIVGVTPWEDSLMKVKAAKIQRGLKVLDICTGLGYTAIASINMGASSVVSVEKDINVLKIAEINPWSRGLEDNRIKIIVEDATKIIHEMEEGSFDRIIHDPPRFQLAGELYSMEFYKELYRVLKFGGILYHYTGQPGVKRRVNFVKGVSNRLRSVGFKVEVRKDLMGVLAFKF
ncbi:MAG: methyltransferase domain-containing protein [archaeon GBS-70-058]|nr:methyltransferase domain-containing protein [Candidatus Culexarchaeum nevadense]